MNAKGDSLTPRAGRTAFKSAVVLLALPILLSLIMFPTAGHAAFPGVNGKIAFTSNRDGDYEIYVMNADGSGVTPLTNNSATDYDPAWSPDGTKIALWSGRDGNVEIYVMNADGSSQTRLTTNGAADSHPAWSPDGTKITFASERDGNAEIYVMDAVDTDSDGNGDNPTRLTNNSAPDVSPSWSPDGSTIAFVRGAGPSEIYVMSSDGSGQTRLSPTDGRLVDGPNWSPDGTKIAYGGGFGGGLFADVYTINANGSGRTNLTNRPAGDDALPAWSPDGTKIAFLSDWDEPANGDIYVMNANGSGVTRLTNNPAGDSSPDWQPTSVVPPNTPPVAICKDARVSADENCEAILAPGDVDGGSYDPDGDDITLSLDNTGPFPLGEHTVTLTVTDEHTESDTCQATVTVADNTVPMPTLTDPICVTVGKGKKTANKLTAGASDNCTQSGTVTIDDVQVFNNGGNPVHGNGVYDVIGNDIYVYPNGNGWSVQVTLTATDEAGNGTTSTITKPLLKCK